MSKRKDLIGTIRRNIRKQQFERVEDVIKPLLEKEFRTIRDFVTREDCFEINKKRYPLPSPFFSKVYEDLHALGGGRIIDDHFCHRIKKDRECSWDEAISMLDYLKKNSHIKPMFMPGLFAIFSDIVKTIIHPYLTLSVSRRGACGEFFAFAAMECVRANYLNVKQILICSADKRKNHTFVIFPDNPAGSGGYLFDPMWDECWYVNNTEIVFSHPESFIPRGILQRYIASYRKVGSCDIFVGKPFHAIAKLILFYLLNNERTTMLKERLAKAGYARIAPKEAPQIIKNDSPVSIIQDQPIPGWRRAEEVFKSTVPQPQAPRTSPRISSPVESLLKSEMKLTTYPLVSDSDFPTFLASCEKELS